MYENTFIIGDVHGCYFTLLKLLKLLPEKSRIIFVGDLVDKGNFSYEVVELVIKNNYEVVLGNHDQMMLLYFKRAFFEKKKNLWTSNMYGGFKTIESYIGNEDKIETHLKFLKSLPKYKIIGKYFITHGFALPYFHQKDNHEKGVISNRINRPFKDWENGYEDYSIINVFGHCDFEEVEIGKNYFGIDTGCVYGRKLTAFELGTHRNISVEFEEKDIL